LGRAAASTASRAIERVYERLADVLLHSRHLRPAASAAPQEQRLGLVLAAAALSMFIVNLDFFALNLSIPAMADELDVSATEMQWVISGYMLSLAAFLIPGGDLRLDSVPPAGRGILAADAGLIFLAASAATGLAGRSPAGWASGSTSGG
jgi:MFS family permease